MTETPASPRPPQTAAFPDFARPDAASALVSPWITALPEARHAAADALLGEWERQSRPAAMLSLSVFLSADGSHLLHYAQWTSDDAHREWARTRRPAVAGRIDTALPGIRRPGLVRYVRTHSWVAPERAGRAPALLTTPAFATAGPGVQRALADHLADELARAQVPGLLGAHLHLSRDGGRVVIFAEWGDRSAWRAFTEGRWRHGSGRRSRPRTA
ncbi:antibiotic biosynthesis monooxygenase [Streptomyces sp. NPDC048638]|uniref:antibiotic biosynthesis monooxygenase n=1 Tax=Streptomyces sp. NPDC048638 TaxID=3365580 RepID=UPI003717CEB2